MRVDPEDIGRLIREQQPESSILDYKRDCYGNSDEERKEFRKDVTAFANTYGGQIIIGVYEKGGKVEVVGFDPTKIGDEIERLQSVLSSCVEPPLDGVEIAQVEVDGKMVLVVSVPASHVGPHQVKRNEATYFYSRTNTQAEVMDIRRLRQAFNATQSIYDAARDFRAERVHLLETNRTPVRFEGPIGMSVHVVPLRASEPRLLIKPVDFPPEFSLYLVGGNWLGHPSFDFEGAFYSPPSFGQRIGAYVRIFRDGSAEAVQALQLSDPTQFRGPQLSVAIVEGFFVDTMTEVLHGMKPSAGTNWAIMTSLWGINGLSLGAGQDKSAIGGEGALLFPEIIVTEPVKDVHVARRLLDVPLTVLWQAFGIREPYSLTPEGKWKLAH